MRACIAATLTATPPLQSAVAGIKPHVPPATANRVDNLGNWGPGDHD